MCEGVGDRTVLQHIDPHSYGHQLFFPVLQGCSTGGLGANSAGCWLSLPHLVSNSSGLQTAQSEVSRAPSTGCWIYLQHLVSNWMNFLCTVDVFLWASQLHSFNPSTVKVIILIFLDRMHLLFTQVHFLFWQPGRVVGQYTTLTSRIMFKLINQWDNHPCLSNNFG